MDLTPEYLRLFSAITDALERLEALRADLIQAQQDAEELYISRDDEPSRQDDPSRDDEPAEQA